MDSFIKQYLQQLESQWEEIDVLINLANEYETEKPELFDVICRSVSILIVAHMEGFTKDLSKNLIRDLNVNKEFSELPRAIQNTCCQGYLGFDKSCIPKYQEAMDDLIRDLSACTGYQVNPESFLFDKNRNPKPESILIVFKRFGLRNVFQSLHNSIFDGAFESDSRLHRLLNIAQYFVEKKVKTFPYKVSLGKFNLENRKYQGRTLWEEFLDEINSVRHAIAHGNTFSNNENLNEIKRRRDKARLLQLALIYISCCAVIK